MARGGRGLLLALVLVASAVIRLSMVAVPDLAGVVQRSVFAIAYLWYLGETFDRRAPGWS